MNGIYFKSEIAQMQLSDFRREDHAFRKTLEP